MACFRSRSLSAFTAALLISAPLCAEIFKNAAPDYRSALPVPGRPTPGGDARVRRPEKPRLWRSGEDHFDVVFHDWGAEFHKCDEWGQRERFPFGTLIVEDGVVEGEIYWELKTPQGRRQFVQPFTGLRSERAIVITYDHPVWDGSAVVLKSATLRLSAPE
jgi:hypothetical protein